MSFTRRTSQLICLLYIITISTLIVQHSRKQAGERDVLFVDSSGTLVLPFEQTALAAATNTSPTPWSERFAQPNAVTERGQSYSHPAWEADFLRNAPVAQDDVPQMPELVNRAALRSGATNDANAAAMTTPVRETHVEDKAAEPARQFRRPVQYRVQAGDSLHRIVQKHYGSATDELLTRLIDANPDIAADPDLLYVGQELTIPPVPRDRDVLVVAAG